MEERLIEYFAVIGAGAKLDFLNDFAEDGTLLENSHILDAQVIDRYPLADHPDVSFPQLIERFSFPIGIHVEARTGREEPIPTYFVFVSSVERNIMLYGHCLTFYEELQLTQHSMKPSVRNFLKKRLEEGKSQSAKAVSSQQDIRLFVPKAFVISSRYNFPSFRNLLSELYRVSCSHVSVPLERYILHLLSELPMPPHGRCALQVDFESETLTFARPPPNATGDSAVPLDLVFHCLSLENLLTVFSSLLAERHIILLSSQFSLLTAVGEGLLSLLFPFKWPFVYIPVLPRGIFTVLEAPTPYLVGMHTSLLPEATNLPDDVIMVNLDADNIKVPNVGAWPPKITGKAGAKLRRALKSCAFVGEFGDETARARWRSRELRQLDWAFSFAARPVDIEGGVSQGKDMSGPEWRDVREAFLRFFTSILLNYRKYVLLPPLAEAFGDAKEKGKSSGGRRKLFDTQRYISSHGSDTKPLLTVISKSQAWHNFLHARVQYLAALAAHSARRQTQSNPMLASPSTTAKEVAPYGSPRSGVQSATVSEGAVKQLSQRRRLQSAEDLLPSKKTLQRAPSLPVLRPLGSSKTPDPNQTAPTSFRASQTTTTTTFDPEYEHASGASPEVHTPSKVTAGGSSHPTATSTLAPSEEAKDVESAPWSLQQDLFLQRELVDSVGVDCVNHHAKGGWCDIDEEAWNTIWDWDTKATEELESALFDECIQAKLNRSKMRWSKLYTPLLDSQEFFPQKTVVSIQYDPTYRDSSLLLLQHPIPKLSFSSRDGPISPTRGPSSSISPLASRAVVLPEDSAQTQDTTPHPQHYPPVCLPARPITSLSTLHRYPLRQWRSSSIASKGAVPPLMTHLKQHLPPQDCWFSTAPSTSADAMDGRGARNPPIAYGLGYLLNPNLHRETYMAANDVNVTLNDLHTEADRTEFAEESFQYLIAAWMSICSAASRLSTMVQHSWNSALQRKSLAPTGAPPSPSVHATPPRPSSTPAQGIDGEQKEENAAGQESKRSDGVEEKEAAASGHQEVNESFSGAPRRESSTTRHFTPIPTNRVVVSWERLGMRDHIGVAAAVLWRAISAGEALPVQSLRSLALMAGHLCHTHAARAVPSKDNPNTGSNSLSAGLPWSVEGSFWRELVEAASDVHGSDEEAEPTTGSKPRAEDTGRQSTGGAHEPPHGDASETKESTSVEADGDLMDEERARNQEESEGGSEAEQDSETEDTFESTPEPYSPSSSSVDGGPQHSAAWAGLMRWFRKAYYLGLLPLWEMQLEGLLIGIPFSSFGDGGQQAEAPEATTESAYSPQSLNAQHSSEQGSPEAPPQGPEPKSPSISGFEDAPPSQPNLHSSHGETGAPTPVTPLHARRRHTTKPLPHLQAGMEAAMSPLPQSPGPTTPQPPATPSALLCHTPTAGEGVKLLKPYQTADHEWHIHLPASISWRILADVLPGLRIQPYSGISLPTHGLCAMPEAPNAPLAGQQAPQDGPSSRATMVAWESGLAAEHDVSAEWMPQAIITGYNATTGKRKAKKRSSHKGRAERRRSGRSSFSGDKDHKHGIAEFAQVAGQHWQRGLAAAAALRRETRLVVSTLCDKWVGTRGAGTPLVLDLLPPATVAAQAEEVGMEALGSVSSSDVTDSEEIVKELASVWKRKSGLFWNLVWYFEVARMPLQPLLQLAGFLRLDEPLTGVARTMFAATVGDSSTLPASFPGTKPHRRRQDATELRPRAASVDVGNSSTTPTTLTPPTVQDTPAPLADVTESTPSPKPDSGPAASPFPHYEYDPTRKHDSDSIVDPQHCHVDLMEEQPSLGEEKQDGTGDHHRLALEDGMMPEESKWQDLEGVPIPKMRVVHGAEEVRSPDRVEPSP